MDASVVMITYNSAKYIIQQIDSILSNLRDNDELIICDDCSNDDTIDIVKSYKDKRIKLYVNDHNLGVNGNMNKALSLCKKEIIYLSNADDIWLEGKIDFTIRKFVDNKITVVSHDLSITDSDLNVINPSFNTIRNSKPGFFHNLIRNGFCGPGMCFRKEMLKYILPFPNNMPFWFDEWIGLICEKHGKALFFNDVYVLWRRHDKCVSFSSLISESKTTKICLLKKIFNKIKIIIYALANRFTKLRFVLKR